jgi:glycosyltransferase involved in cell wall biosynthesis
MMFQVANRWSPLDDGLNYAEADLVIRTLDRMGWRPDLIHCHSAVPAGSLGLRLAVRLSVPLVVTEHQHIIIDYFPADSWPSARQVYRHASRVAAVSEFQRHMMLMNDAGVDPIVIGNFVDEQLFDLLPPNLSVSDIKILFVGLASPLKDYSTFFSALGRLRELTNNSFAVKIVCADAPHLRGIVAATAAQHPCARQIEVLPQANRAEMQKLLEWSSVFVSTSIAETFGVAVCEALMCGRPVVTTSSGGVADFVVDGWNGFIVRIGDAEAIARRIVDAVNGDLGAHPVAIRNAVVAAYGREAFLAKLAMLYEGAKLGGIDASKQ